MDEISEYILVNTSFNTHNPDIYKFRELLKINFNRHQNSNLIGHTATQKLTNKKIVFIKENINQFKGSQLTRIDFVKKSGI